MGDRGADAREAMDDWDARLWAPAKGLCIDCMPPGLAAELMREVVQNHVPIGITGYDACAKCKQSRSRKLWACTERPARSAAKEGARWPST